MSTTSSASPGEILAPASPDQEGPRRRRRRVLAAVVLVVVAAAVVVVVTDPFAGGGRSPGVSDNGYQTSLAMIVRQALSSQTQVSATLGYAGDSTIRVPTGSAPAAVAQAQESVMSDQDTLATARASLATDGAALAQARATLSAEQQLEAVDCSGEAAAQSAASGSPNGGSGSGACATAAQSVATDQQAATADAAKIVTDQTQRASAEQTLASGRAALSSARSQATVYGQDSTYTALPEAGAVIGRGQRLYAIDGQPVALLYGSVVATRTFAPGMSAGADVGELNANLDALGYGHDLAGGTFTSATSSAIRAFQSARGETATGELPLGSVMFEHGPVRITSVMAGLGVGSSVVPGPVLTVSSTARQVTIELDAAQQGQVKVGDAVTITLPDNETTPGRISHVSTVASSSGSGGGGPTIEVDAVPTDPGATGTLDQAPVNVSITTASVGDALVVPVDALLALSGGGYAIEEVGPGGIHHLVAVGTGLFDDADGLVQLTGNGLAAGQRVVVPGT